MAKNFDQVWEERLVRRYRQIRALASDKATTEGERASARKRMAEMETQYPGIQDQLLPDEEPKGFGWSDVEDLFKQAKKKQAEKRGQEEKKSGFKPSSESKKASSPPPPDPSIRDRLWEEARKKAEQAVQDVLRDPQKIDEFMRGAAGFFKARRGLDEKTVKRILRDVDFTLEPNSRTVRLEARIPITLLNALSDELGESAPLHASEVIGAELASLLCEAWEEALGEEG